MVLTLTLLLRYGLIPFFSTDEFTGFVNKVVKHSKKQITSFIFSHPFYFLFSTTDIQEDLENDEACAKIISFIKVLPEIYFDVLSMHLLFGFSTSEIASSLGLKHSTAKQRLTRGKKLLREVLEGEGIQ